MFICGYRACYIYKMLCKVKSAKLQLDRIAQDLFVLSKLLLCDRWHTGKIIHSADWTGTTRSVMTNAILTYESAACGFCSISDKGTNCAKKKKRIGRICQFPWQRIHRKSKGPESERKITMVTHLEHTHTHTNATRQRDAGCCDALRKSFPVQGEWHHCCCCCWCFKSSWSGNSFDIPACNMYT